MDMTFEKVKGLVALVKIEILMYNQIGINRFITCILHQCIENNKGHIYTTLGNSFTSSHSKMLLR